jgi:hypothetical protein
MNSNKLEYLESLKQAILLKLKDLIDVNADLKSLRDTKDSYDLINYNIDQLKSKYKIMPKIAINTACTSIDPYSDLVTFNTTPVTTDITKTYLDPCNTMSEQINYLKPQINSNITLNIPIILKKLKKETFPVTGNVSTPSENVLENRAYNEYSDY